MKVKINIKFQEFADHMRAIDETMQLEDRLYQATQGTDVTISLYAPLADNVIRLLEILTDDQDNWIEYFVYELDSGREYTPDSVRDEYGCSIPLSTIEDLWKLLKQSKKVRESNAEL